MRKFIASLLLLCGPFLCFTSENDEWVRQISQRVDGEASEWFKQQLREKTSGHERQTTIDRRVKLTSLPKEKCHNCLPGVIQTIEDPKLLVFMSFSVPDSIWLSLAQKVAKVGGIFVLRGVPENSFKELARQILKLKEKGLNVDIQLNPKLFQEYEVKQVPCFVVTGSQTFDKIYGNISIEYALNILDEKGETSLAKSLKEKLEGAEK